MTETESKIEGLKMRLKDLEQQRNLIEDTALPELARINAAIDAVLADIKRFEKGDGNGRIPR